MSSKSKLITAIVLLAVGAGLIPTGLVTNDYLRDQVYDGVPEAMLKIKADAVPGLEDKIPVLGLPDILKGIFDEAVVSIDELVRIEATPAALLGIRSQVNASIPDLINVATVANGIAAAYGYLDFLYGAVAGSNVWFNDTMWVDPNTGWPGLANYTGVGNFTWDARANLYWYGMLSTIFDDLEAYLPYGDLESYIPGLIMDLVTGDGVAQFLKGYGAAWYTMTYWVGDPSQYALYAAMTTEYNATWAQLTAVNDYINAMIAGPYVSGLFSYRYGVSVAHAIDYGFYMQWANASFSSTGFDLGGFKGIEAGVNHLNGTPTPTNISLAQCQALWDPLNPLSFTNDSGIYVWAGALQSDPTALAALAAFGLTSAQLNLVLNWLGYVLTTVTPIVVLATQSKTTTQIATLGVLEQWANVTIFGDVVVPGGFLAEIDSSFSGAPYFEIGLPNASGLAFDTTSDLWDPLEDDTFIYGPSFQSMWLPAMQGNPTSQDAIIAAFGMSPAELTAILTWMGAFLGLDPSTGRAAQVLAYNYGQTITQIATAAFYEQWSNGTINGIVALPDGFLAERVPPVYGPPYFEIGLSFAATLTLAQCAALWNVNSEYSLVTVSGVHKWYKAAEGNTMYTTLATQNGGLNFIQMSAILEWLPEFRDVIVNILAEDDKNLPMEPYDLGQTLAISLGAGGGALAALGVVFLILSRRS